MRVEPEWHAGFLVGALGIPQAEAMATVEMFRPEQLDARGRYQAAYTVCGDCAAKHPALPRPVLSIPGESVPTIEQP